MRFYHCSPSYSVSLREEKKRRWQSISRCTWSQSCVFVQRGLVGRWIIHVVLVSFLRRRFSAALIVFLLIMSGKWWRLSVQLPLFKDAAALGGTPAKHQTGDADQSKLMTSLVQKRSRNCNTSSLSRHWASSIFSMPNTGKYLILGHLQHMKSNKFAGRNAWGFVTWEKFWQDLKKLEGKDLYGKYKHTKVEKFPSIYITFVILIWPHRIVRFYKHKLKKKTLFLFKYPDGQRNETRFIAAGCAQKDVCL